MWCDIDEFIAKIETAVPNHEAYGDTYKFEIMNIRKSILFIILRKVRFSFLYIVGIISPILLAKILFMDAHPGHKLNLKSPKTLADKVNWLKFNTNTEIWSQLADKYLVRDFVIEKGLEETLNPIYGIYDRPEDIDFGFNYHNYSLFYIQVKQILQVFYILYLYDYCLF